MLHLNLWITDHYSVFKYNRGALWNGEQTNSVAHETYNVELQGMNTAGRRESINVDYGLTFAEPR